MDITCYRDTELLRESLFLPASVYNTALLLLDHSNDGSVFVPVRAMQYLAVIDSEEIIFLDSDNKSWVAIAWQNFHPQQRNALAEPVSYEAVYYTMDAKETMKRLLVEFPPALKALAAKEAPSTAARIIKLDRKRASD